MNHTVKRHRRGQPVALLITTILALIVASLPLSAPAVAAFQHTMKVDNPAYEKQYGHWDMLNVPDAFKLNTIHAASLPTGKILLVAGSGNQRDAFNEYNDSGAIKVLKTVIYNPADGSFKNISTPSDLFCSGHTLLPSGKLLVAGGTSGYELLKGEVKKPAGAMTVHNENPDDQARSFPKGTKFTSPSGKVYLTTADFILPPAMKMTDENGMVMVHHSSAKVFVEAAQADSSYVTASQQQFSLQGLTGDDTHNIYGQGDKMTLDKQDYRGDNKAYEFDPLTEKYERVGDMTDGRWYASLPVLADGSVLAISGLDATGKITETTEVYDPATKLWSAGPDHQFPTYPAMFRTKDPDVLFYSGSSAGYGPADENREPGFWNVKTNTFTAVSGLRDTDTLETSGSVMLPPAKGSNDGSQSTELLLAGGGGVGESAKATARTDMIDLSAANPKYSPGPDLPAKLRYLNLTVTPWDEVIANGGSTNYRAKHNSYSYKTFSFTASSKVVTPLADEIVGRSYHSGSILLGDGRILVFGNDPLYADKADTTPGTFDKRIEIYTPPQLYAGSPPKLDGAAPTTVQRGQQLSFTSDQAVQIKTARLIPPSTTTHVTNVEQRSVGAIVQTSGKAVTIQLPADAATLPDGWYMLFVSNAQGTPSQAKMIQVVQ